MLDPVRSPVRWTSLRVRAERTKYRIDRSLEDGLGAPGSSGRVGARGFETPDETTSPPEDLAGSARDAPIESPRLETVRDDSRPVETARGAESTPTDAELERAIVDAVRMGLGDVARTLAARLEARPRGANVVSLDHERARRR